jgi:hypothetical protein
MRTLATLALAGLAVLSAPALAQQPTARASGTIPVYAQPDNRATVIGYIPDGTEVTLDYCTENDREWENDDRNDRPRIFFPSQLQPDGTPRWCFVTETGWVKRGSIVGNAAKRLASPPEFVGRGW